MLSIEERQTLVQKAIEIRSRAYARYSNYPVGAALLSESGKIYCGVNIENAAYPSSICAERVAVFKAVSEGERQFRGIAVVTENGGSPCGACRQVLSEFGLDIQVLICDRDGNLVKEMTVRELLPGSFGPSDLRRG